MNASSSSASPPVLNPVGSSQDSPRFRRPGLRDSRLLIGILLVLISVVGTLLVIRAADHREGYWVATSDIVPGTELTAENFTVVDANLADSANSYWPANEELPETFTLAATVRQGEFVPRDSVTEKDPEQRQQLAVTVTSHIPENLGPGSRVDAWISWPEEQGTGFQAATLTASFIEVAAIEETTTTSFGSDESATVHLLLPGNSLSTFIDAQAAGARIALVPAATASGGAVAQG